MEPVIEDTDSYCREVEAYLCRRNAGHLVRVVGPAFDMVAGWAARGIPIKVALRGIDRTLERQTAKDPRRRRPVRVEFCEADVLDAFDEWRRAVGVGTAGGGGAQPAGPDDPSGGSTPKPTRSLRAHLDRVATRLTDLSAAGPLPAGLDTLVERLLADLGEDRAATRVLRGDARREYLARLQRFDDELLQTARAAVPAATREALRDEASRELAPFRSRMPEHAFETAVDAASDNLLRDRLRLPVVRFDP